MDMNENGIIYQSLLEKKQKMIEDYDEKLKKVKKLSNENDFVKAYYLLAETFHNTMEQGEIAIKFLKKNLTNDFFNTAAVKNGVNYIIFSNEDFEVKFSKSISKEIIVNFKNAGILRHYYSSVSKSMIKFADLLEAYLNKKSFKNFKALVQYNCEKREKNLINKIIGSINTYKTCNKELLDKIRGIQERDKLDKIKVETENKKFKEKQIFAKTFLNNLTDLKMFKNEGWYINIQGIMTEDETIKF